MRIILKDHPDFAAINEVRFELAESLAGTRALEDCIALCRENLELAPEKENTEFTRLHSREINENALAGSIGAKILKSRHGAGPTDPPGTYSV